MMEADSAMALCGGSLHHIIVPTPGRNTEELSKSAIGSKPSSSCQRQCGRPPSRTLGNGVIAHTETEVAMGDVRKDTTNEHSDR